MIRRAVGAIVSYGPRFLLVHKVKINAIGGKENIQGELDFVKGGVEDNEDLKMAMLRELEEETGSSSYALIKQFEEKICFEFPPDLRTKIGYDRQETTMFHFEYVGDPSSLKPLDNEIDEIMFVEIEDVLKKLTHSDTRKFFEKYFSTF
ncbi:NUDIX hydrolase [Lederbergia wuyishanensis]|uniref:(Di)nucleoside polyphosphate hydrolase n=1 Tax=Lederbergia wuyishanensis TaxID=1347903 RepID=A0ABU0D272_9BACI|nr:NUDIX hydrolase [Lederbergia wuyishanensis]MCJ8007345.1 NUDIX hydrolase [Lederbergia wuyishanensis]MDQ0342489.1 putative (di)nucleoside polyphosphate hydrolase [Lederbergia wuyishanensis]